MSDGKDITTCICKNGHHFNVPKQVLKEYKDLITCECGADRDREAEWDELLLALSEVVDSGVKKV